MKTHIVWAIILSAGLPPVLLAQQGDKQIVRERTQAAPGSPAAGPPEPVVDTQNLSSGVSDLAFSPDGHLLAAAGDDKTVRIWDLDTGQIRDTLRGPQGGGDIGKCLAVAFSPGGRELVVGVQAEDQRGSIRVYDPSDPGRIVSVLNGHSSPVQHLAFSRDGKYLVSAGSRGDLMFWDWATRRPLRTDVALKTGLRYLGFPGDTPHVFGFDDQSWPIWSATDGTLVQGKDRGRFEEFLKALYKIHYPFPSSNPRFDLRLDPGLMLIGASGVKPGKAGYHFWVGLWSTKTPQPSALALYEQHRSNIQAVALSPDATLVASAEREGDIHVWEAQTGRRRWLLSAAGRPELVLETQGFTGDVDGLDFSPDGHLLAAAGKDKTVRIWDLDTGQLRATPRGQRGIENRGACSAVAFSPSGRELVVAVWEGVAVLRVYDTSDLGRIVDVLTGHSFPVQFLAFTHDGKYFVSSDGHDVITWDWATRRPLRTQHFGVAPYLAIPGRNPHVFALADGQWRGWSVIDGSPLAGKDWEPYAELLKFDKLQFPFRSVPNKAQFRLDPGLLLFKGEAIKDGKDHYWVGLWTAGTLHQLALYEQHRFIISTMTLSPDATLVASADQLGEVHVWEARTGRRRFLFRGQGSQIYKVGFEPSGRRLAFGTRPFPTGRFTYNNYAELDQTFDLENRRILQGASGDHATEVTRQGERVLTLEKEGKGYAIRCTRQGRLESRYTLPEWDVPYCYSFLHSRAPGFEDPVVIVEGRMPKCRDPRTMLWRREFIGHSSDVYSISESPDGRFLATGSLDRTIRIWSLEHFKSDFATMDLSGFNKVTYLVPGGSAEKAGIRIGDRILRLPIGQPGQRVTAELERDGKPYKVEVTLVPGGDSVDPLLSLFVTADGEWVLWTPQGYYDASLGGDRLIGWHVNQGWANAAKFYTAQQFRKEFYRPDVIDRVLQVGDVPRAIALANAARGQAGEALDLRRAEDLRRLEPPRVRLLEPAEGTRTRTARITVRAEVRSQNELPITDVTVLVNGRPAAAKDPRRDPGDSPLRRTVIQEVELVPGANQVAVVAANAASTSQPIPLRVVYDVPAAARIRPNLYLLAIGISRYARPDLNLQFAHQDAAAFADAWKAQQGEVYDQVQAQVLTDQQATAAAIRDGMDWLVRSATQHDLAILFLSAHGTYDNRRNYYLATHDLDPDRLRSTAIPYSDVVRLIQDLPCKVLLFVDTCHSGGITGAKGLGDDPLRELVSEAVGTVVFASSTHREVSLEDVRWGHGAFTRALLDCLGSATSDLDGDGYLGLTELDYQLSRRVKELTAGQQHPVTQKPPTISDFNFYKLGGGSG